MLGLNDRSSYTVTEVVMVPNVPSSLVGSAYVLFVTNSGGTLQESKTANDLYAVPITLTAPKVDLAISNPTASQTTAVAGNGDSIARAYAPDFSGIWASTVNR